jgi:tetrahydromethanopterin S-methyltransferase subunit G
MLMQTKGCARIMNAMAPEKKWTDHRLDDLAKKVDAGATQADKPLGEFRGEVNARFDKVDERFEKVDERFEKVEGKIEDGIKELRGEMRGLGEELRGETKGLGKELRGETKDLGKELRGEIRSLRTSIYLGAGGIIAALVGISALA